MAAAAAGTPESMSREPVDGDSPASLSPASSAESNFRELDDAFLQTQTRIWLGEVLQIRFDEQANISDILADGELLFEVSEVISRMLPTFAIDATQPKLNEWKSLASSKSTRRYMPYYNVGAFLQMCKNLGLDSIDLFTPSDVVEKRNTRKVCMCLRSLSKKIRSRDLNVPDFDSVTCTLTMPTDMVQYIRKSLERSQSSSSLSVEQDSEKVSSVGYWRRISNSASPVSSGYSDNCDDAESISMASGSHESSNHACDSASPSILGPEFRDDETRLKLLLNMDLKDEGDVEGEYLSPAESVGSPHSEYYSDQEPSSVQSSTCLSSCLDDKALEVNTVEKHGYQNVDVNHVPYECAVEDDLFTGEAPISESESFEDEQEVSKNNIGKSNSCDLCVIEDDFCADETPITKFNVLDEQRMAAEEETFNNGLIPDSGESHSDELGNVSDLSSESLTHLLPDIDTIISANIHQSPTKNEKEAFDAKLDTMDHTERCFDNNSTPVMDLGSFPSMIVTKEKFPDEVCQDTQQGYGDVNVMSESIESRPIVIEDTQEGSENRNVLAESVISEDKSINIEDADCVNSSTTTLGSPQLGADGPRSEDTVTKQNVCMETMKKGESEDIEGEDNNKEIQPHKPRRKLLKSVVKGTALVGIAVFLLHLRKNIKPSLPKEKQQPVEAVTRKPAKPSVEKVQKAGTVNTSSVYPAEKLRLGI